ncbi:MAG: PspA-associated protein PspAA [Nocardioidaceae bacterium]
MIVRILGEGQWDVADDRVEDLNTLDAEVEAAIESGDTVTFSHALGALLAAVRAAGEPLPVDSLEDSQLILPPADASLEEVREMLDDEGLIPG